MMKCSLVLSLLFTACASTQNPQISYNLTEEQTKVCHVVVNIGKKLIDSSLEPEFVKHLEESKTDTVLLVRKSLLNEIQSLKEQNLPIPQSTMISYHIIEAEIDRRARLATYESVCGYYGNKWVMEREINITRLFNTDS